MPGAGLQSYRNKSILPQVKLHKTRRTWAPMTIYITNGGVGFSVSLRQIYG